MPQALPSPLRSPCGCACSAGKTVRRPPCPHRPTVADDPLRVQRRHGNSDRPRCCRFCWPRAGAIPRRNSCGKVKLLFGACTTTDAMTEPQQQHQRHHVYDIFNEGCSLRKQTDAWSRAGLVFRWGVNHVWCGGTVPSRAPGARCDEMRDRTPALTSISTMRRGPSAIHKRRHRCDRANAPSISRAWGCSGRAGIRQSTIQIAVGSPCRRMRPHGRHRRVALGFECSVSDTALKQRYTMINVDRFT